MLDLYDLEKGTSWTEEERYNLKTDGPSLPQAEKTILLPVEDEGFDTSTIKDPFSHPT